MRTRVETLCPNGVTVDGFDGESNPIKYVLCQLYGEAVVWCPAMSQIFGWNQQYGTDLKVEVPLADSDCAGRDVLLAGGYIAVKAADVFLESGVLRPVIISEPDVAYHVWNGQSVPVIGSVDRPFYRGGEDQVGEEHFETRRLRPFSHTRLTHQVEE